MAGSEDQKIGLAMTAGVDEIERLLHDPSPKVIRALLGNRNLREEDVLTIAQRKNLPPDILETIAKNKVWAESYPVRLALAGNPKTPLSISLSIVRYLRLFDIAEMSRSHHLPLAFRNKVETIIIERVPAMPLGHRKTLAKRAAGNVLFKLMQDTEREVISLCLGNPRLQESHLFKLIGRSDTRAETIRMIAGHGNWSGRPLIRYALVRSKDTPLALSKRFLRTMRLLDLQELYADPSLPLGVKPLIHRELLDRGIEPGAQKRDTVVELDENDDIGMEEFQETREETTDER